MINNSNSSNTNKRKVTPQSKSNEDNNELVQNNKNFSGSTTETESSVDEEIYYKNYLKKPDNIPNELKLFKAIRLAGVLVWICTFTVLVWIMVPINIILLDPICRYYKVNPRNFSLELLSRTWARGILFFLNIKVVNEDNHNIGENTGKAAVMLYNHTSYLDPVILEAYSPIPSRYIFKKELLFILPVVFVLAYLVGHIPINRKKKDSAIDSINEAAEVISRDQKCLTISPEGTRSVTGRLKPFKKGPFHLALKSNALIIPVIHFGNQYLWPTTQFLPNSGTAYIRFLKPFPIPKQSDVESLSELTRVTMLKSLAVLPKNYVIFPSKPSAKNSFIFLIVMIPLLYSIFTSIKYYLINELLLKSLL